MPKWEYMHVRVDGYGEIRVNDEEQEPKIVQEEINGVFGKKVKTDYRDEPIHEFLNRVGREGWELVSATSYSSSSGYEYTQLFLKRPLPESES